MSVFCRLNLVALTSMCLLASAMAADTNANTNTKPKKPRPQGTIVTFQNSSSSESPAERDRRLIRECKGRPNAGACLGYAQP